MRPAKRRSYFGRGNIEAGKNRTDLQNLSLSPSLALSLSLSLFLEGTDAELQPQGVQCEPEACNERRIMVSLRGVVVERHRRADHVDKIVGCLIVSLSSDLERAYSA